MVAVKEQAPQLPGMRRPHQPDCDVREDGTIRLCHCRTGPMSGRLIKSEPVRVPLTRAVTRLIRSRSTPFATEFWRRAETDPIPDLPAWMLVGVIVPTRTTTWFDGPVAELPPRRAHVTPDLLDLSDPSEAALNAMPIGEMLALVRSGTHDRRRDGGGLRRLSDGPRRPVTAPRAC